MSFDARDPGTSSAEWMLDSRLAALPPFTLADVDRVIVVAAHPDDETLGAGALIRASAALGLPTEVLIVTDGAASHPGSPTLDPAALAALRAQEVETAVHLLNPRARLTHLGLPDGDLAPHSAALRAALEHLLAEPASPVGGAVPSSRAGGAEPASPTGGAEPSSPFAGAVPSSLAGGVTLLVCPWRGDAHPDHELVGTVCAALVTGGAADSESGPVPDGLPRPTPELQRMHLRLAEYPIWLWHWGRPGDADTPWSHAAALAVDAETRADKLRAIAAHRSQVEPLSSSPGDEALLNSTFLTNFDRDREVFFVTEQTRAPSGSNPRLPQQYFDDTYARSDDPWGFTDRWYEERKRSLTVASLPEPRFGSTLEIGCSIGVLTEQLAARTDSLLSVDIASAAIEQARRRLADHPHVRFAVADVAERFPDGRFDLVVLSEVGYYFDAPTLRRVLASIRDALTDAGVFVACHWRHGVSDYLQTGDGVHTEIAAFAATAGWTRLAEHREDDFVLEVYSRDGRSVAARTGLL